MSRLEEVQGMLKEAMKSGDAQKRDALRMILNALKQVAKDERRELSDSDEIEILSREAKKRREAIESFRSGGRDEQAAKEQYELDLIKAFLPKELSQSEVEEIIRELFKSLEVSSIKDKGKVMKSLMPMLKGQYPGKEAGILVDKFFESLL